MTDEKPLTDEELKGLLKTKCPYTYVKVQNSSGKELRDKVAPLLAKLDVIRGLSGVCEDFQMLGDHDIDPKLEINVPAAKKTARGKTSLLSILNSVCDNDDEAVVEITKTETVGDLKAVRVGYKKHTPLSLFGELDHCDKGACACGLEEKFPEDTRLFAPEKLLSRAFRLFFYDSLNKNKNIESTLSLVKVKSFVSVSTQSQESLLVLVLEYTYSESFSSEDTNFMGGLRTDPVSRQVLCAHWVGVKGRKVSEKEVLPKPWRGFLEVKSGEGQQCSVLWKAPWENKAVCLDDFIKTDNGDKNYIIFSFLVARKVKVEERATTPAVWS
ncbi:MAG TPA: hypothetical protein ENI68_11255 [Gammaproteobacteria bacterium]|nr:hypothetical protein [Gammaproteobacteria bacterium]